MNGVGRWNVCSMTAWCGLAVALGAVADVALAHGHGGGHGYGYNRYRAQMIRDANSWRDGFRGPHDFGGGVTIPQDAGLNKGLGGGLDGRGFGAAAAALDGGGRLDGSDLPLDGGATRGYRTGRFAGTVDTAAARAKPAVPAMPTTPAAAKPAAPPAGNAGP